MPMAINRSVVSVDESQGRNEIISRQAELLGELVRTINGRNIFYTRKFSAAGLDIKELDFPSDLVRLPLTTKAELIRDQETAPPWGTVLTESIGRYTHYNQTSGTTGRPLRWLDTIESWQWMLECWQSVYRGAHVVSTDRILFPFSFGPFLGFWTAYDAAVQCGLHCIPAGGMSSDARLDLIEVVEPTVICCTPTYALRLLEVAGERGGSTGILVKNSVRVIIVSGEPGGNIPATRARIEQGWGARVIDHHGLTEVGPVSFECWEQPGSLHLNECRFIGEVLDPQTQKPTADGNPGELVLTNLGRFASPVIRYRTGDIVVRTCNPCECGRTMARFEGGIRTRADDMLTIRGVNVYPTAVEAVLRAVDEIVEYRATVSRTNALPVLSIEIELDPSTTDQEVVSRQTAMRLHDSLGFVVPVTVVSLGSLPRFEIKAKRFFVKT